MLRHADKNPAKPGGWHSDGTPDPHNLNPDEPVHELLGVTPAPPDLPQLPDFDPFPTPVATPR